MASTQVLYPTNWSEFLTAVGTENAYVECPADEEWDMNEIAPNGITSTTDWRAKEVRGNNLKIKNLVFKAGIEFPDSYQSVIKNLHFLNIYDLEYAGVIFNGGGTKFAMKNCELTGQLSQATLFYQAQLAHDGVKSCELSLNFINTAKLGDKIRFDGCRVELSGDTTADVTALTTNNCYFMGRMPFKRFHIYNSGTSTGNVFDIYVPETSNLDCSYSGLVGVFVADKMAGTYKSSKFKPVTTAQLTDIPYLQSIGFPAV